ncbi:hypothetical protein D3C83_32480 [compost metagenome]
MARIHGRSAAAGATHWGAAATSEIGVWITDIQNSTASALSVAVRRLVKMNDEP